MRFPWTRLRRCLGRLHTVIWMVEDSAHPLYSLRVRFVVLFLGLVGLGLLLLGGALVLIAYTPLQGLIPSRVSPGAHQQIQLMQKRLLALEDSLRAQAAYIHSMRQVLLGEFRAEDAPEPAPTSGEPLPLETYSASEAYTAVAEPTPVRWTSLSPNVLEPIVFPAPSPVEGVVTRGLDARIGHWGIDIAAPEGSLVGAIADGFVVFADWTQEGGYTIVLQHARNFLSVYKHNQRLLRRLGERVRAGETIALSGRSGMITTGPHLHLELWHEGIPLDPLPYLYGVRSIVGTTDR